MVRSLADRTFQLRFQCQERCAELLLGARAVVDESWSTTMLSARWWTSSSKPLVLSATQLKKLEQVGNKVNKKKGRGRKGGKGGK